MQSSRRGGLSVSQCPPNRVGIVQSSGSLTGERERQRGWEWGAGRGGGGVFGSLLHPVNRLGLSRVMMIKGGRVAWRGGRGVGGGGD